MHAFPFGASLVINDDPRCHFNDRTMSVVTPTSLLSTVVRQRLILMFLQFFSYNQIQKKTLKSFQTV